MVKTRESTRFLSTLRSGNGGGKNIGNRKEKVSINDKICPCLRVKSNVYPNKLHMLALAWLIFVSPKFIDSFCLFLSKRNRQVTKVDQRQNLFHLNDVVCGV